MIDVEGPCFHEEDVDPCVKVTKTSFWDQDFENFSSRLVLPPIAFLEIANKFLRIYYSEIDGFSTVIKNNGDDNVAGSTTRLYTYAHRLMQDFAKKVGRPVFYSLVTSNSKMIMWAKSSGTTIFSWKDSAITGSGKHHFETLIFPSED